MKTIKPIETIEEFEDVLKRVRALDVSMPGSPGEDEQRALRKAVEKWKKDHAEMPEAIKPRRD